MRPNPAARHEVHQEVAVFLAVAAVEVRAVGPALEALQVARHLVDVGQQPAVARAQPVTDAAHPHFDRDAFAPTEIKVAAHLAALLGRPGLRAHPHVAEPPAARPEGVGFPQLATGIKRGDARRGGLRVEGTRGSAQQDGRGHALRFEQRLLARRQRLGGENLGQGDLIAGFEVRRAWRHVRHAARVLGGDVGQVTPQLCPAVRRGGEIQRSRRTAPVHAVNRDRLSIVPDVKRKGQGPVDRGAVRWHRCERLLVRVQRQRVADGRVGVQLESGMNRGGARFQEAITLDPPDHGFLRGQRNHGRGTPEFRGAAQRDFPGPARELLRRGRGGVSAGDGRGKFLALDALQQIPPVASVLQRQCADTMRGLRFGVVLQQDDRQPGVGDDGLTRGCRGGRHDANQSLPVVTGSAWAAINASASAAVKTPSVVPTARVADEPRALA